MATARLRVVIDTDAQGAITGIRAVGDASKAMGDQTRQSTDQAESGWSKLGSVAATSARVVGAAWTAAAAGIGTVTVSAFRTGVEFNSMQQRANAALTTVLGSASAAADMMAQVTEFASTSPFPRQAFITATQQMLAFGIEADRVIPILSGVQDAVAAAGGSSQQLSEVTFVLAQIQAAGKITAQDLMQLGQRGIDAAGLIGSQMGMTGQEIRDAISAGSLDAGEAIDALAAGMTASFGGAADGVRNTWAGTLDSINGRIRDIGAALAEAFVTPTGGGYFIEWGGAFADVLAQIRDIAREAMPIITEAFGPTFDAVAPSLEAISTALAGLDVSSATDQFLSLAPALGALTGGFAALTAGSLPVIGPMLGGLTGPIGIVIGALAGLIAMSPELQALFGGVLQETMAALAPVLPVISGLLETLAGALTGILTAVAPLLPLIAELAAGVLVALIAPLTQIVAAIMPPLTEILTQVIGIVTELFTALMPLLDPITQLTLLFADLIASALVPLMPIISEVIGVITQLASGAITSLIIPAVTAMISILSAIITAIQPILPVIMQLISVIISVAMTAIRPLIPVILNLINALMPLLSSLTPLIPVLGQLLSAVLSIIAPIIQLAAVILGKLVGAIAALAGGAINIIAGIISGISSALSTLIGWITRALAAIARFASAIGGGILSAIGGVIGLSAEVTPSVSGASFAAPLMATGGGAVALASFGASMVRAGDELGRLTRATTATASGGRGSANIHIHGALDPVSVARTVQRVLRDDQRRRTGVTIDRRTR